MALPLEVHENFEAGTKGVFNSESDAATRLDFPHQKDLWPLMPWRGAYCCRVNLGKANTDAYLEKTVSWASGQVRWGRFRLFIGNDVQSGNNLDHVRILQFYSSTSTSEAALAIGRVDPMGIVLATIEGGDTFTGDNSRVKMPIGEWTTIEWWRSIGATAGYIGAGIPNVCWLTSVGEPEGTNTKFRLGATDQVGDIQGHIYFDDFEVDEDRLWSDPETHNGALSGGSLLFLKSGFAYLGEGVVEHVQLMDGGSGNCRVKVYDTDVPTLLPVGALRENLATLVANATEQSRSRRGFRCRRGAYVELSGTNPQVLLRLGKVANDRSEVDA